MSKIHSISDSKYIKPSQLHQWIINKRSPSGDDKFAIIDVRDSDHIGGHIKGSWHYPSSNFSNSIKEIQNKIYDLKIKDVVFHCMLSQSRGPSSTLKFLRSIDEIRDGDIKNYFGNEVNLYILKGGFAHWQDKYGKDPTVTENYDEEIYRFGAPT
ncbi:ibp1 [Candida pseudojiufengensis]|uniref:ibp1 n=1 Tax=Candida pseudojiufengensis TaxID=497109 RepID=UPI0022245DA6|nr:ibp1 [Candida pseudojiufengensis]KAI5965540.1 ibp1 [Candida pseudojiufengensis]